MTIRHEETGQRIRALRLEQGLTREQLAEKADISVQFLADIEKGRKSMTIATLKKLSAALLVSTERIVNGTTDDKAEERLSEMLAKLTPRQKMEAIKLLRILIEALQDDSTEV